MGLAAIDGVATTSWRSCIADWHSLAKAPDAVPPIGCIRLFDNCPWLILRPGRTRPASAQCNPIGSIAKPPTHVAVGGEPKGYHLTHSTPRPMRHKLGPAQRGPAQCCIGREGAELKRFPGAIFVARLLCRIAVKFCDFLLVHSRRVEPSWNVDIAQALYIDQYLPSPSPGRRTGRRKCVADENNTVLPKSFRHIQIDRPNLNAVGHCEVAQ